MLNAFNARSIFELGAKDRFRIESLLAYGDKLLLGLSNGVLQVYRVLSSDTPEVSLELIRTIEHFTRSRIEILACIKEAGILVSLADGNVNIHDLSDFSLTEVLGKAKRASTLAVTSNIEPDEETRIPELVSRLAVGVRRRLLLYCWKDGGFQEGKEVTLGGDVKSLTWASKRKVIVGLHGGFVVVDVHSGNVEEVLPPPLDPVNGIARAKTVEGKGWASYMGMGGWSSRSLSTRLHGDELLLVKDSTTLFVDAEGKPLTDRPPIPWTSPPDAVGFSYPYLVSLSAAKHQLEVRNPPTRTLLQTISLPTVTTLHVPPPNVALSHAGNLFYVASPTQVWRMGSTDYESQINELMEAGQLDEAIKLVETLESVLLKDDKDEKLAELHMLKAQRLFERKKWEESMRLFSEISAPPERVIKLFPPAIAGEISIWDESEPAADSGQESGSEEEADMEQLEEHQGEGQEVEDTGSPAEIGMDTDGARTSSEAGGEAPQDDSEGAKKAGDENPRKPASPALRVSPRSPELNKPNGHALEAGSLRNLAFTRKYGDAASIFSFGSRRLDTASAADKGSIAEESIDTTPKPLEGDELKKAVNSLSVYLLETRGKLKKFFPSGMPIDPITAIDKNGHKSPLEAIITSLEDTSEDADPVKVRIENLVRTATMVDTALFRTYILIRPGLVGHLVRIENFCDPEVVSEKLREQGKFDGLVDFLEQKKLHREALELLRFFGQADKEESKAPNLHGPHRTVTYLTRLTAEHIDLILEFTRWPLQVDPKLAMEVFVGDTGNSDSLPRPRVLRCLDEIDQLLAIQYLEHLINEQRDETPEFHTRLVELYLRNKERIDQKGWHQKLLDFLSSSSQYRAERVFSWLPRDKPEFYEARAIVLSKMGRHKAALEIYVFKLRDPIKAERYCSSVHMASHTVETDTPAPDNIYHTLLSLYLRPPEPHNQQLEPALGLLSRHGARLDAAETLKLVPEDIKISSLESYFESRIRAANARVSESRIAKALRNVHRIRAEEKLLLEAKSQHAVVGEENVCPVCHKRLGLSVIWRLPNGQVVHYGCGTRGM